MVEYILVNLLDSLGLVSWLCVMGHLEHEQFLFSFSFIFWLYKDFVFFFFFLFDEEEVRDTAVTWHVTWCDIIKPRTWWKGLEDDVRAPGVHMVALSKTWGRNEDEAWT